MTSHSQPSIRSRSGATSRTPERARRAAGALLTLAAVALLAVSCGSDSSAAPDTARAPETAAASDSGSETDVAPATDGAPASSTEGVLFPDVVDANASESAPGVWTFSVTLSSPYDTAERYADAWRVLAPDGTVLGVRELTHDHADEQPFTRSLSGVEIPADVDEVTIEGRDQVSGWGGATVTLALDRRTSEPSLGDG